MRPRRVGLSVIASGLAFATAAACASSGSGSKSGGSAGGSSNKPYVFAAEIPLTGGGAAYGAMAKGGMELAVSEINAAGGINGRQLKIDYEDDQLSPALAATGTEKEAGQGVKIVITHGSATTMAMIPVAEKMNLLLPNIAAQSSAILKSKTVYSFLPTNETELGHLADLAYTKLGVKKLAIISSDEDYGKSAAAAIKAAFEKLGGTVVASETHPPGATDMRAQLIKIKATNPDAIAVMSITGSIGNIINQARELGYQGQLLGADSSLTASEVKAAGPAMDGVEGTAIHFDPNLNSQSAAFASAFQSKNGMAPNNYGALAYETVKILSEAIKSTGTDDPAKVGAYLLTVKNRPGALGDMTFGSDRVVELPFFDWKFENGAAQPLTP